MNALDKDSIYNFKIPDQFIHITLSQEEKSWISVALKQVQQKKDIQKLQSSFSQHFQKLRAFEFDKIFNAFKIVKANLMEENTDQFVSDLFVKQAAKSLITKRIANRIEKGNYPVLAAELGQKIMVEIAKLAAQKNAAGLSANIQNYGIDKSTAEGQRALIEIAKLAAQQNAAELSAYIQNYGIDKSTSEGQRALIEIAELCAQKDGKKIGNHFQNFGIKTDTPEKLQALIEIAKKLLATKEPVGFSKNIQNFGIDKTTPEGQLALIEIAKLAAQKDWNIFYYIHNYGIDKSTPGGQRALIEIAELAALQNYGGLSEIIRNFGIDPSTSEGQQALIKIAKLAVQKCGWKTSEYIQNYSIDASTPEGQLALIEIAKLAAKQCGSGTSQYIQNYGINKDTPEGQSGLIEIAKLAVQRSGLGTSQYIQNYGIKNDTPEGQSELIEIAKLAVQRNAWGTSEYIQNYGIDKSTPQGQQALIEIAKLAAMQNAEGLSQYIQNYSIDKSTPQGQQALIEIAKLAAQKDAAGFSKYIRNYGIDKSSPEGQRAFIEIAKLITLQNAALLCQDIQSYGIDKSTSEGQLLLIEFAKLAAQKNGCTISTTIQNYGIDNSTPEGQRALIEIAKLAAQQNGCWTSNYIKNYGIDQSTPEGQRGLIEIAKLAAQQDGWRLSIYIQNYGIDQSTPEGQRALIEIAKLAVRNDAGGTSMWIKNYGIDKTMPEGQQALIEIAKLATRYGLSPTSLQNYGIDISTPAGKRALIEIVKLSAQSASGAGIVSEFILQYGIDKSTPEGQQAFIEIAKLAAQKNAGRLSEYIQNYGLDKFPNGQQILIEVAKLAAQQNAGGFAKYIENYGIDKFPNGNQTLMDIFMASVLKKCHDGFNLSEIDVGWVKIKLEKNKNLFNQKRLFEWFISTADACSKGEGLQQLFKSQQNTLQIISKLSPTLRDALTQEFMNLSDNPKQTSYEIIKKSAEGIAHAQNACVLFANFPPEKEKVYLEVLKELSKPHNRDFRVGKNQKLLLETLLKMKSSTLDIETKASLLEMFFKIPFNERRECFRLMSDLLAFKGEADLQKMHDELKKEANTANSSSVSSLENSIQYDETLEPILDLKSLLQTNLETLFENQFKVSVENFSEQYDKTIGLWRTKEALITYAGKLNELGSNEKTQALTFFKTLLTDILDQNFEKNRYAPDKNPHLAEIQQRHPAVLEKWQQPMRLEAAEIHQDTTTKVVSIPDMIVRNLKEALFQKHLGAEQQASLYPQLSACIGNWEHGGERLIQLDSLLSALMGRPLTADEISIKQRLLLQKGILELLKDPKDIEKQLITLKSLVDKKSAFYHDITSSLNLMQKPSKRQTKTLQVLDTDNPNHFLLMGTEVQGSCQSVSHKPHLNKCLLGYFLDGKHRLGLVCNEHGNILARSVFRLLIDNEGQPVLFQEAVYVADANPEYRPLLRKLALKKAASLGIPLIVSQRDFVQENAIPYPHAVKALGKPVPFEYVDALGGIQAAPYVIPEAMHIKH